MNIKLKYKFVYFSFFEQLFQSLEKIILKINLVTYFIYQIAILIFYKVILLCKKQEFKAI